MAAVHSFSVRTNERTKNKHSVKRLNRAIPIKESSCAKAVNTSAIQFDLTHEMFISERVELQVQVEVEVGEQSRMRVSE